MIRPHDLIWISDRSALSADQALPEWVSQQWRTSGGAARCSGQRADPGGDPGHETQPARGSLG
jgi:hypothetical protein